MKKPIDLGPDDYIAFGYNYYGGEPDEIIVGQTCFKSDGYFTIHFAYGTQSLAETVKFEDVLAIGNLVDGQTKLRGWKGTFDVIKPENPLIKSQ